ncbi:hypothetical protein AWB80_03105 [Caballeronia pedi]|uniref:Uncharacterized protein n=1 Tax=Caballeronia pedi TaxID=1777141 RepID=A0A158B7Q8_9BURK|nr:hypothetical protein [Caballeronia pedi]SAK65786.1 hypothetical protein AWB80_03105 [Caballeronia pedi]
MEPRDLFPVGAYELRLTDIDLAHLRAVVPCEVKNPRRVLPLAYWRWRVSQLLASKHLMPAQLTIAHALLDQIDAGVESAPLAKAS